MTKQTNKNQNFIQNKCVLGLDDRDINFDALERPVHKNIVNSIAALKQKASDAGFDLALASGYRSCQQQSKIWNEKATGKRPVLDDQERPINIHTLPKKELVFYILRWSALPGASRHHWGTDIDIYDVKSLPEDYSLKLTVSETKGDGVLAKFYLWLSECLSQKDVQFFRPYSQDKGGVAVEPWHLSYGPLAEEYQSAITESVLAEHIASSELVLKDEVLKNLNEIYHRFIVNVSN